MATAMKRSTSFHVHAGTVRIQYGDITSADSQCIVSSDDTNLGMLGGVSQAILRRGGASIRRDALKHSPLSFGDTVVTTAGELNAKYVIHAATIDYAAQLFPTDRDVATITSRALKLAEALGVESIAFPALGTGVANITNTLSFTSAAHAMMRAVVQHFIRRTRPDEVTIWLYPRRETTSAEDLDRFFESAARVACVAIRAKTLQAAVEGIQASGPVASVLDKEMAAIRKKVRKVKARVSRKVHDIAGINDLLDDIIESESTVDELIDAATNCEFVDNVDIRKVRSARIKALETKLAIESAALNKYEVQKATFGGDGIPFHLEMQITEVRKRIAKTEELIAQQRQL